MLREYTREFMKDEQGAGTIMGLLWFILLVGITGMAVDVTDGFRNRTMLQATADSSALAAAIDLPDNSAAVVATAVAYSVVNMGTEINGSVLDPTDIHIGLWDAATKSLDTTSIVPDAVMVTVRRSAENANAVPANFLRIIGLQTWNVTAQAVAQRYIPGCLRDGMIARDTVYISSNNNFVNRICVHGEQGGVHMSTHNYFETGVTVSMPDLDMLVIPDVGMTSNPGLPEALRENHLDPRMVNHVDEIMLDMLDRTSPIIPDYINTDLVVLEVDENFDLSTVQPGRIYHVNCGPNKTVLMPVNVVIREVVIVSECEITFEAKTILIDTVLASRNGGNGDITRSNITVNAQVQFGMPDNCTPGGGVQLFSNASMNFAAQSGIDGVQMVATGNIDMNAREMAINGISAQTGGNITVTSNNSFGLCSGGVEGLFTVDYYRLVL